MINAPTEVSVVKPTPFVTLSALRKQHGELLKQHRDERDGTEGTRSEFFKRVTEFIEAGQATGTFLLGDDERWEVQGLLDYWAKLSYSVGVPQPDATLAEFDPDQAPQLDDSLCPYVGLNAFSERQHNLFFGRTRLLTQMTDCLSSSRFLAIVGSSGGGKSSLVLGGLLPRLKNGAVEGSERWLYFKRALIPGSNPLRGLAGLLWETLGNSDPTSKAVSQSNWIQRQCEGFLSSPAYLTDLISDNRLDPAILVVDQFEEVFTLCTDEKARTMFIDNLVHLVDATGTPHRVILTMRIDFEDSLLRYPNLNALVEQSRIDVKALTGEELRDAIEKPARTARTVKGGLEFEQGVVSDLVKDVLGEPAGLPLLQFTLRKLWDKRQSKWITRDAYDKLGGARRALATSADEFYESLIDEDRLTMKLVLLRLVRTSDGLEVFNNRIPRETLYVGNVARDRMDNVLLRLLAAGLVRMTGDKPDEQIEISHEALIRNWPRFGIWLDEDRANLSIRRRLDTKAAEWVRSGRKLDTGLITDPVPLREAEEWLISKEAKFLGYHEALPALVTASKNAVAAAEDLKLKQAQAQAVAEEQTRTAQRRAEEQYLYARRLKILSGILALFFLASIFAASFAVGQWRSAVKERTRADKAAQDAVKAAQDAVIEKDKAVKAKEVADQRLEQLQFHRKFQRAVFSKDSPQSVALIKSILSHPVRTKMNFKVKQKANYMNSSGLMRNYDFSPDPSTPAAILDQFESITYGIRGRSETKPLPIKPRYFTTLSDSGFHVNFGSTQCASTVYVLFEYKDPSRWPETMTFDACTAAGLPHP